MNEDFGLDWYDYGARWYDASIGRWNAVDALADEPEQIDKSVYAYAWNNPVNLTDPDGNCPSCKSLKDFAVFRYNQTKGLVTSVANSAASLVRLQLDPSYQRQTVEGIANAISNPGETFNAIKKNVAQTISDAATGDPATAGEAQGRIAGTLLEVFAGSKGLGSTANVGRNLAKLEDFADLAIDAKIASKIIGSGPSKLPSEFTLLHTTEEIINHPSYSKIKSLSDDELIKSVTNPSNGAFVTVNTKTGRLSDGNTRIYELQRRGLKVQVPYEKYTPDDSAFWDLH